MITGKHFRKLKLHYKKILIALVALLIINVILGPTFKFILLFLFFTIAGAFSTFYRNYLEGPVNLELVKLGAILMTVTYGPIAGISVGIVSSVIGKILTGKLDQTLPISVLGIVVICIIAGFFPTANIATLGIILVLVYQLITAPFILMLGGSMWYGIIYIGTNILFNIPVFVRIAPMLLSVMK